MVSNWILALDDFSFFALGFVQIHEKETFPSWLRPKRKGD